MEFCIKYLFGVYVTVLTAWRLFPFLYMGAKLEIYIANSRNDAATVRRKFFCFTKQRNNTLEIQ